MTAERNSRISYRSCPHCVTGLVHEQLYRAEVYLSQLSQGQGSVPCLRMAQGAHTWQTHWTLGVKDAWALYGLPNVSTPLYLTRLLAVIIAVVSLAWHGFANI